MLKTFNLKITFMLVSLFSYVPKNIHASEQPASMRIVGGSTATISSVPYLVNLRRNGTFFCGGSLVSAQHVLTAAHCVKGLSTRTLIVVGGATYLSTGGIRRGVAKIITPKGYRASTMNMDVAILKLSTAMSGQNIETIAMCSVTMNVGDFVQVSGWGQTSEQFNNVPNQVRTVKVPLISKAKCIQDYKREAVVTKSMFCASVPSSKDSCSGDSGGPAVYKGQLCGIVSWGIGCARRTFPGVYTKVSTVRAFIDKAMQL